MLDGVLARAGYGAAEDGAEESEEEAVSVVSDVREGGALGAEGDGEYVGFEACEEDVVAGLH